MWHWVLRLILAAPQIRGADNSQRRKILPDFALFLFFLLVFLAPLFFLLLLVLGDFFLGHLIFAARGEHGIPALIFHRLLHARATRSIEARSTRGTRDGPRLNQQVADFFEEVVEVIG